MYRDQLSSFISILTSSLHWNMSRLFPCKKIAPNTTVYNPNKIMQSCHPNPIKRIVFSKCGKEENIYKKMEHINEPISII